MGYRYDTRSRLMEARGGPSQAIIDKCEYDNTGNRTGYSGPLDKKVYTFPAGSH